MNAAMELTRLKMPDLAETCRARARECLAAVQTEWDAALRRALAELPAGPPLEARVRAGWPFALPNPVFTAEPEAPPRREPGLPRDRDEAVTAARDLAERGRRVAGKAAADLHRGIGSLLDRAAAAPDAASTPGRLIHGAKGAWSQIRPPETGEATAPGAERLTPDSREVIRRYLVAELEEMGAYLERLRRNVRQALARRAGTSTPGNDARTEAGGWRQVEAGLDALLGRLGAQAE
jgi:hypothetical protein